GPATASAARQAAAALLRGPGRPTPAAVRDPGERSPPDQARVGVPPGEPPARILRAAGRPAGERLRAPQGSSQPERGAGGAGITASSGGGGGGGPDRANPL